MIILLRLNVPPPSLALASALLSHDDDLMLPVMLRVVLVSHWLAWTQMGFTGHYIHSRHLITECRTMLLEILFLGVFFFFFVGVYN